MRKKELLVPLLVLALALVAIAPAIAQVQTPLSPTQIPKFAQTLPLLDPAGVPFTLGDTTTVPGKQLVNVDICEFQTSILPAGTPVVGAVAGVAPKTWVWGYQVQAPGAACDANPLGHSYLGPVVLAKRGTPTEMTLNNKLPDAIASNVLAYKRSTDVTVIWGDPLSLNTTPPPINLFDPTLGPSGLPVHPSEDNLCYLAAQALVPPALLPAPCYDFYGGVAPNTYIAPIPSAVHIHGGEVPAGLDGGPDSWWTPNGIYGHGYYSKNGTADAAAGKAIYTYPNGQEPSPLWFHDHILGATRLNVYAGIAGGYYLTDDQLTNTGGLAAGLLPLGLDRNGNNTLDLGPGTDEILIPLIIQDRMFDTTGQLFFPAVGINPEHPYWVPEFIGDTIVVNGKAWPFLNVQPKRYRFLVLNGSNARSYELFLFNKLTGLPGPPIWVIGNDQGYLDKPQLVNPLAKLNGKLVIMPGERYEIIVDFTGYAGTRLEMRNTAKAPYPAGSPPSGSTTGRIMQFRVSAAAVADTSFNPAAPGATIRTLPSVRLANAGAVAPGVVVQKKRRLTLNEVVAKGGPLEILVNNTLYDGTSTRAASGLNDFTAIPTMWNTTQYSELPNEGETELWEIVNLTADAHPIHPHLVAFQILNRQVLDLKGYTAAYGAAFPGALYLPGFGPPLDYNCGLGVPGRGFLDPAVCTLGGNPDPALFLMGLAVPPAPQEIGWKDTVMAPSGWVTRVLVRFGKTTDAATADPNLIGYDFNPDGGHGYVWHCHIIDHEDNEMMRPYTVQPTPGRARTFVKGIDY